MFEMAPSPADVDGPQHSRDAGGFLLQVQQLAAPAMFGLRLGPVVECGIGRRLFVGQVDGPLRVNDAFVDLGDVFEMRLLLPLEFVVGLARGVNAVHLARQ
jgi:hypothetical protein